MTQTPPYVAPGILYTRTKNDIVEQIQGYQQCRTNMPSQQKEPLQNTLCPDPFEHNNNYYLIIADYTTDYLKYKHLKNGPSEVVNS